MNSTQKEFYRSTALAVSSRDCEASYEALLLICEVPLEEHPVDPFRESAEFLNGKNCLETGSASFLAKSCFLSKT